MYEENALQVESFVKRLEELRACLNLDEAKKEIIQGKDDLEYQVNLSTSVLESIDKWKALAGNMGCLLRVYRDHLIASVYVNKKEPIDKVLSDFEVLKGKKL